MDPNISVSVVEVKSHSSTPSLVKRNNERKPLTVLETTRHRRGWTRPSANDVTTIAGQTTKYIPVIRWTSGTPTEHNIHDNLTWFPICDPENHWNDPIPRQGQFLAPCIFEFRFRGSPLDVGVTLEWFSRVPSV